MSDYSNLKGKTPFDLFPTEVVMKKARKIYKNMTEEQAREFFDDKCSRTIYELAKDEGNEELARSVVEQFPQVFACCLPKEYLVL